jgi:hypothetical protein
LSATSLASELKSNIFDGNSSEIISFSSEESKDTELVAPFDDETTKKNNLGPSDFLGLIGAFFFFPFVALAIVAYQDLGVEYGAMQMILFYVLNACVPAFYWIHYYFIRFPFVIILMHILLWSTATSSLVYLMMGPLYFEGRHITFGAVLGLISTVWHAWLVVGVCGSNVKTDDDETDDDNDDTDNDDDINNNNNRRKSIESLEV